MNVYEKNIFITGANRGIGKALAEEAARRGMFVHALCRTKGDNLDKSLIHLGAKGVRQWHIDMSSKDSIDKFIADVKAENFSVDVLINNAGQLTGGLLEEQSIDKIYQMLQVNLAGLIHLTHGLLPNMLKLKEAKIVNNSSVSGIMFLPCASTYAASKAGVVAFTQSLKQELRSTQVSTLLMLTPGVKSRMYDEISDLYGGHLKLEALSSIPPEEWAKKVFYSIEKNSDVCMPKGFTRFSVWLGQHWPWLLERLVRPTFSR